MARQLSRDNVNLLVDGKKFVEYDSIDLQHSLVAPTSVLGLGIPGIRWSLVPKPGELLELEVVGIKVFAGYIDSLDGNRGDSGVRFSLIARDLTADLESSLDPSMPEMTDTTLADVCALLVKEVPEVELVYRGEVEPLPIWRFERGASVISEIYRAARSRGYIVHSNGVNGIVVQRPDPTADYRVGIERSTDHSISIDHGDRYNRCTILADQEADFGSFDGTASVLAESIDPAIRTRRRLVVIADRAMTPESAALRAQWEQALRAAESEKVTVSRHTWFEQEDRLWQVNSLARVTIPAFGLNAKELLLSEVSFSWSDASAGGERAELTLVRADAYVPEPSVPEEEEF